MRSERGVTVSPCPLLWGVVSSSPISKFCLWSCQQRNSGLPRGRGHFTVLQTGRESHKTENSFTKRLGLSFFLILKTPPATSVCTKNLRCEKPRCRGAAVKLRNVPCLGCQGEVFGRVLMGGRCSPCRWCRAEGLIWHLDRGSGGKALRRQGWLFSQRLFHSGGVLSCHCKGSSENV